MANVQKQQSKSTTSKNQALKVWPGQDEEHEEELHPSV